jgi:Fur family zinc uptake transcriptional regulator
VDNLNVIINHAEVYCKAHGARLTDKRKLLLKGLIKAGKALSAYELIDFCQNEFGSVVHAMTAYRILAFLQSENLVRKLNSANKFIACSQIISDDGRQVLQFLICPKCDKVEEISIKKLTLDELNNNVEHAGFHLVAPYLEMKCVCNACYDKI